MRKRVILSVLLILIFGCFGVANIPQYRIKFTTTKPFLLEPSAKMALPAGEYWIKDVGTAPGHLLSIETKERQHLGWLNTVRIDRAVVGWRDEPKVVFDFESSTLPVLKRFYLPGTDGYEILSVYYDNEKGVFVDVDTLLRARYVVTEKSLPEPYGFPVTMPIPETPKPTEIEKPIPTPQPSPVLAEPRREEPAPPPIPERKRVRKD
ncbi:MAG: hypothetical protein AB1489_34670 [Acidobacteriota bacterium]